MAPEFSPSSWNLRLFFISGKSFTLYSKERVKPCQLLLEIHCSQQEWAWALNCSIWLLCGVSGFGHYPKQDQYQAFSTVKLARLERVRSELLYHELRVVSFSKFLSSFTCIGEEIRQMRLSDLYGLDGWGFDNDSACKLNLYCGTYINSRCFCSKRLMVSWRLKSTHVFVSIAIKYWW